MCIRDRDYRDPKLKYRVFNDEELKNLAPYSLQLVYRGEKDRAYVVDILE